MDLLYKDRSLDDQEFIKLVCNKVLSIPLEEKEESRDFCGIYIEGRPREINTLEDYASLKSFKVFSKFNYPIIAFVNNTEKFLDNAKFYLNPKLWNIHIIKIDPINSLDEYTNFVVKKLYHLIPNNIKWGVHLQPDAMLLRSGWEDKIIKKDITYLGPIWGHAPAIEYKDKDNNWKDFFRPVRCGNGGFSIRRLDFCRAASTYYKDMILREKYAPNNKIPPEDLLISVLANNLTLGVPTIEEVNQMCVDPLTPEIYNNPNRTIFGFHYFSAGNS